MKKDRSSYRNGIDRYPVSVVDHNATKIDPMQKGLYHFRGSVPSYSNLPTSGMKEGDTYNVEDDGMNYAWTGDTWDSLGATFDMQNYYTKQQTDSLLSGKASTEDVGALQQQIVVVPTGETSLAAQVGKYYKFADELGTFDITLPAPTGVTTVQAIVFYMMTMGSAPAVTFTSEGPIYYHDGFSLEAGKTYEVNALWNGSAWVVASVEIVVN